MGNQYKTQGKKLFKRSSTLPLFSGVITLPVMFWFCGVMSEKGNREKGVQMFKAETTALFQREFHRKKHGLIYRTIRYI